MARNIVLVDCDKLAEHSAVLCCVRQVHLLSLWLKSGLEIDGDDKQSKTELNSYKSKAPIWWYGGFIRVTGVNTMQVWFEHEGGYDLVNSVADIPETATGHYIENENGDIIEVSGSCDWMLDQNIYDIIWESEVCF